MPGTKEELGGHEQALTSLHNGRPVDKRDSQTSGFISYPPRNSGSRGVSHSDTRTTAKGLPSVVATATAVSWCPPLGCHARQLRKHPEGFDQPQCSAEVKSAGPSPVLCAPPRMRDRVGALAAPGKHVACVCPVFSVSSPALLSH